MHYVSSYLSVKSDSAQAHKLQGYCYEKLSKIEKALAAYQLSMHYDPKQNDLLIDVCKLLLSDNLSLGPGKIRYWCDLAQSEHVQHESVLNLKMKLLSRDNANPKQIEEMLHREIAQQPSNVSLRIQVVKHLLDQHRLADAFKYVYDLEMKQHECFSQSLDWYNTIAQVVAKLNSNDLTTNWMYHLLAVSTVERQLSLNLSSDKSYPQAANLSECAHLLFQFDQTMEKATKAVDNVCPEPQLAKQFLLHYRGQLCLHAAALIFKRENVQKTHWREIMKNALPLLLLSYNAGVPNSDEQWCRNSSESTKQLIRLWGQTAAFRCAQSGRTLLSCIDDSKENTVLANIRKICTEKGNWSTNEELLTNIRQFCSDSNWRKHLFRVLFPSSDQIAKQSSSYLVQCLTLAEPVYQLPRISDLETYEENAQWLHPSSLQHQIYLCLGTSNIADFKCSVFNGLHISISNLASCGAETLNQLDIDSFLYAATIQAKLKLETERSVYESVNKGLYNMKPKILPFANVASGLATEEQCNWWLSAYKVYKNTSSGEDLGEIRATLQYGIEAVRGVGGPKVDLMICLKLGQIFIARAQDTSKSAEKGFYEARAEALFKFSLHLMRMQNNRSLEQYRRFFKYSTNSTFEIEREINASAEEAVTFLAARYFKNEEYKECVEELSNIQLPFATYFQAEAYRKMEESNKTPKKNKRVYIEKARDYLQQTLVLLEYPHVDKNHALKSIVHDDIKNIQQQLNNGFNDSFNVQNNSFSNGNNLVDDTLNESVSSSRQRREAVIAASATAQSYTEVKQLMMKMMEQLSIVQDDVAGVRTKVANIEEQLQSHFKKQQDTNSVDPASVLDDYFIIDEELQNQGYNTASMYPNYNQQRMHTPNQMLPQMMTTAGPSGLQHAAHQQAINPYNNTFYNSVYQMGMNPYQALMPQQRSATGGIIPSPVHQQYPDPSIAYSLQQQTQQLNDVRNISILGLLTQPTAPLPIAVTALPPPTIQQKPPAPVVTQTPEIIDNSFSANNLLKTWNSSYNNAPVEKGPPINVVITNSEPLPSHTTITPQHTLSVTIPQHHIKNNSNTTTVTESITPANQNNLFSGFVTKSVTSAASTPKSTEAEKDKTPIAKNTVGGLSFSSTPISTPVQDKAKPDTSATKPNPFANFSFNLNGAAGQQQQATSDKSVPNIFGSLSSSKLETASPFGNLGKSEAPFSNIGKTAESPSLFSTLSKSVESTKATEIKKPEIAAVNTSCAGGEVDDDYVPTAHFEPVIALPDLVETKTGEEDEITKFEHRAKLLRYVKETKEWKERGIGNMKVLVNKADPNKIRLLMRREQVLKLCCNQLITKDTKFTTLSTAGALTWYGQDYSDNELQAELLAIRFKTADVCKSFHNAIVDAQNAMIKGDNKIDAGNVTKTDAKKTGTNTKDTSKEIKPAAESNFGEKFKPKAGSWECKLCYISNCSDTLYCVACESPKDDTVPKKNILAAAPGAPKFAFGVPFSAPAAAPEPAVTHNTTSVANAPTPVSGFGNMFKPKAGSWECKACYISNGVELLYCTACETPKDETVPKKNILAIPATGPKLSFGVPFVPAAATTATVPAPLPTMSFSFGTFTAMTTTNASNTGNIFGSTPATVPAISSKPFSLNGDTVETNETIAKDLSLEPKQSFSFVFKPKSPTKAKSPLKNNFSATEDVSDDENIEEENNTYFTPAIPLPDKVTIEFEFEAH